MPRLFPGFDRATMPRWPWPSLQAIKLVHTAVWAMFAGAILAIPIVAWRDAFGWAAVLIALVAVEVLVLAGNGGNCPLTAVAARYTTGRAPNFDIYLPRWLARWNKVVFGALYVAGLMLTLVRWMTRLH